jgi:hypothetical protein
MPQNPGRGRQKTMVGCFFVGECRKLPRCRSLPAPFRGNQIAANYRAGPHGTLALRPRCLLRACGRIMGQLWRSVLFAPWVGKGGVSLRPMVGKIWDRQDQSGGPFWS